MVIRTYLPAVLGLSLLAACSGANPDLFGGGSGGETGDGGPGSDEDSGSAVKTGAPGTATHRAGCWSPPPKPLDSPPPPPPPPRATPPPPPPPSIHSPSNT